VVEMNVGGVKIAIRTPLVNKVNSLDIANSKIFECLGNHLLAEICEDVGDIETDVGKLRRHF
jgi:glutamine synthetase type III